MYFVDISKLGLSLSNKRDQSVYKLHDGNNRIQSSDANFIKNTPPAILSSTTKRVLILYRMSFTCSFCNPDTSFTFFHHLRVMKRVLILYRMSFTCSFCNPDTSFTFFHHLRVIVVQDSRKS
jgi:hypothetical protein